MTEAAIHHDEAVKRPARRALLGSLRELALLPAIGVLFVVGIASSPAFFTTANLSNTAQAALSSAPTRMRAATFTGRRIVTDDAALGKVAA